MRLEVRVQVRVEVRVSVMITLQMQARQILKLGNFRVELDQLVSESQLRVNFKVKAGSLLRGQRGGIMHM